MALSIGDLCVSREKAKEKFAWRVSPSGYTSGLGDSYRRST